MRSGVQTEEQGQPLVVGDELVLADVDPPRLLEEGLVVPVRVQVLQDAGEAVVLAQKHHLQQRQLGVLVDADVT